MNLIDSHCHLDLPEFDPDRQAVLARSRQAGVGTFIIPGVQQTTWRALIDLCAREPDLFPALGLHPCFIESHEDAHLLNLVEQIALTQPVAVGEIGLDFHVSDSQHDKQIFYLNNQLSIAVAARLPVILHVRKAHDPMLKLLKKHKVAGGICHAFNGSIQQAHQYLDLGFKLGFGGMLTFERSTKLRRLTVDLPLDAIVLETDAPDMTGASHQYQRNSPEYLPEIAQTLAELKGLDIEEIGLQTSRNVFEALPGVRP